MFEVILSSLYFFLPAYIANMCPVFAAALRLPLGTPVHVQLFGTHKTYRGMYAGILGSVFTVFLQMNIQNAAAIAPFVLLQYTPETVLLFGILFGCGTIAGDMVHSYVKRRLGRRPGSAWFPFDQLDFVLGALLFLAPFFRLDAQRMLILLLLTPVLHLLTNIGAYQLGLKKVWW